MNVERMNDKRSVPRYAYPKTIEYSSEDGGRAELQTGVVVNISASGICLYVYRAPREGQILTLRNGLPMGPKTAEVLWTRKLGDGFYQAGLRFILN